jgi:hypothetical protein
MPGFLEDTRSRGRTLRAIRTHIHTAKSLDSSAEWPIEGLTGHSYPISVQSVSSGSLQREVCP